jgi:hypothetical protein
MQLSTPRQTGIAVGRWLRLSRQRLQWTQAMLSKKSSVPVATISRMERSGQGSIESLLRLLHAIGGLDTLDAWVAEHIRQASLPLNIRDMQPLERRPRQRVRPKRSDSSGQ